MNLSEDPDRGKCQNLDCSAEMSMRDDWNPPRAWAWNSAVEKCKVAIITMHPDLYQNQKTDIQAILDRLEQLKGTD